MSAKPASVPVWNTGGANNIEPSAGKKVTGWSATELPPVQDFHWLHKLIGEWLQYLSDGALTDITITGFKHGDMVKAISPLVFSADANWAVAGSVFYGDVGYIASSGAGHLIVPIPMVEGERIKSLTFARYGDGAADFTSLQVFRLAANGTVTDITAAATTDTNPAASWADKTVDVTDTTAAAGDVFWFHAAGSATGLRIGSIRVTYDRP